jgi:hypothetical protein
LAASPAVAGRGQPKTSTIAIPARIPVRASMDYILLFRPIGYETIDCHRP